MSKNKRCVYVADSQAAAIGISHWLDRHGVENLLVDKTTLGMTNGISFTSNDPSSDGWQVWVKDIERLEEAHRLLAEKKDALASKAELGPINATCEECETSSRFEGEFRGTIQNCPTCGRYMDVGGLDDEFDWPESFESR